MPTSLPAAANLPSRTPRRYHPRPPHRRIVPLAEPFPLEARCLTLQRASPTYNRDLAAASVELAERGLTGLYHVAGSAVLDRYAFALLVAQVFGLDTSHLIAVKTDELRQKAGRPLAGGLSVTKAQAVLATPLRPPAEGLRAMRAALAL